MWRFALGQSIGSAHEKMKLPCQDRIACASFREDGTIVAALADGAGSAALAHEGAELVVSTISSIVQFGLRAGREDHQQILRESLSIARQRLEEAAAERKAPLRDLACTVLAVAITPGGGAALQLGDGVIVTAGEQPQWRALFWPQKGEYANTTFFLTDEAALANASTCALPAAIMDVALLSDGLENLALQLADRSVFQPFFKTAFAPLYRSLGDGEVTSLSRSLAAFLASKQIRGRTEDDVSLVLGTRREHA
jgi:Protein phosphatase 2C